MFNRVFDRRVYVFLLVLFCSGAVGVTFGFYAMWPANVERGYEPVQPIAFSHLLHAGSGVLPDGRMGLAIDCRYCHSNVETGPAATVPPVSTCMNCHSQVQTKVLPLHDDHRLEDYIAEQLAWWASTGHDQASQLPGRTDEARSVLPNTAVSQPNETGDGTTDVAIREDAHGEESDEPVLKLGIAKVLWHWENKVPIRWVKVHDLADFVYFDHSRHIAAGLQCANCHGPIETMERVRRVNSLKMAWCLSCHRQAPTETTSEQYRAEGLRGPINCNECHR